MNVKFHRLLACQRSKHWPPRLRNQGLDAAAADDDMMIGKEESFSPALQSKSVHSIYLLWGSSSSQSGKTRVFLARDVLSVDDRSLLWARSRRNHQLWCQGKCDLSQRYHSFLLFLFLPADGSVAQCCHGAPQSGISNFLALSVQD